MNITNSFLSRALLVLALTVSTLKADNWSIITVWAAGAPVKVIMPYPKAPEDDPATVYTRQALAGANSELLAYCASDVESRHTIVSQTASSRGYQYSTARWARDVAELKKSFPETDTGDIKKAVNDIFDRILDKVAPGAELSMSIDRPVMFPISDESERHATFLMLIAADFEEEGVRVRNVAAGSTTMIWVGGRLLTINIYEPFVDRGTYDKVQKLTKEVVRRTLAANPS